MSHLLAMRAKLETYLFSLNEREKLSLKILVAVVLAGLILHFSLVQPYGEYTASVKALAKAQRDQAYLVSHQDILAETNLASNVTIHTTIALREIASSALSSVRLVPDSLSNDGQKALTVAISDAQYSAVAELLNRLRLAGIAIRGMQMVRLETGVVNLTITIQ